MFLFFFATTPTTHTYTLSLHDALPISGSSQTSVAGDLLTTITDCRGLTTTIVYAQHYGTVLPYLTMQEGPVVSTITRSEEHTSELQSRGHLVCRLLLEKKKKLNTLQSC